MNKKFLLVIAMCTCFLTACGNNSLSNGNSNSDNTTAVEEQVDQQNQEKDEAEAAPQTDLSEKYKDILEALENEDYEEAIDLIKAMMPEPESQVVEINLENWTEYFSIEMIPVYDYDAKKNYDGVSENWRLLLKPEYEERVISLSGEVGIEAEYEDEVYKIINVDQSDGSYETETIDMDTLKTEYERIMDEPGGPYFSDWNISDTYDLKTNVYIMDSDMLAFQPHSTVGGRILIKEASEWTQYIRYPKIKIVRIEGELVLSM